MCGPDRLSDSRRWEALPPADQTFLSVRGRIVVPKTPSAWRTSRGAEDRHGRAGQHSPRRGERLVSRDGDGEVSGNAPVTVFRRVKAVRFLAAKGLAEWKSGRLGCSTSRGDSDDSGTVRTHGHEQP